MVKKQNAGPRGRSSSDIELTRRAAEGDDEARRRLAERLLDRVGLTVRCLAAGDPDADDFVQLAMIEILESAGSFRAESKLETWAERITVRTAMRVIKQKRWRSRYLKIDSEREGRSTRPTGEEELTRHRVQQRIPFLLLRLTPERRLVVTLRLVLGYSIAEIAAMTGMKFNTVRDRLKVGRSQLRREIPRDPLLREYVESIQRRSEGP